MKLPCERTMRREGGRTGLFTSRQGGTTNSGFSISKGLAAAKHSG